ncbi:MAG: metallopeptidase family protein [Propioniciclava sp.]
MAIEMGAASFDRLVEQAIASVPADLMAVVDNCILLVEDDPPDGEPDDLLGLYVGVPLTERDGSYAGVLPDRIMIFRNPTLDLCTSAEEVVAEVRITVVHEIAHHFGIDDDRLHAWGYG